jgi:hypothetical protein
MVALYTAFILGRLVLNYLVLVFTNNGYKRNYFYNIISIILYTDNLI